MDDIELLFLMALDHVSHVIVPAAAPASTRRKRRTAYIPAKTLNRFRTTREIAAALRSLPEGRSSRGKMKFTAANAPTCATEIDPAKPSEIP
jgi:hypothetical protein